jgi:hypothetical protein
MFDKINIGAGRFYKTGWTNIDHASGHYHKNKIDIDIDFLGDYKFPISDNMIKAAYCSHVVEHLPESAVERMFDETFRVLDQGGIFRITCPDARAAFDALKCGNDEFFNIYDASICFNYQEPMQRYHLIKPLSEATTYQKFLYFLAPQRCVHVDVPCLKFKDGYLRMLLETTDMIEFLNIITADVDNAIRVLNPWMHISWWTIQRLKSYLWAAGFRKIYQSDPGLSQFDEMRDFNYFDCALPKISLYIEAVK